MVSLIVNDGTVNSSPDTVTITANAVTINVEVSIKPETINLKSKGKFKAFIELPEPYSADEVVLAKGRMPLTAESMVKAGTLPRLTRRTCV